MWVTLTACFACFLVGGYVGLCLGYSAGREEVREVLVVRSIGSADRPKS